MPSPIPRPLFFDPKRSGQCCFDLAWFGEAPRFAFRKEQAMPQGHLEDTATTGVQADTAGEMLMVIVQHDLRQTGGTVDVASRCAVADLNGSRRRRHLYLPWGHVTCGGTLPPASGTLQPIAAPGKPTGTEVIPFSPGGGHVRVLY